MPTRIDNALMQRCFGWNERAWARPVRAFLNDRPGLHVGSALEIGADRYSSLSPMLTYLADTVTCSYFNPEAAAAIKMRNDAVLPGNQIAYAFADMTALSGRWDMIVSKSVLGGIFRTHNSTQADINALIERLVHDHLHPGGYLVLIENGRSLFEPLLQHSGARKNHWRFFRRGDLPAPAAHYSFGVASSFALSTRLGVVGRWLENLMYALDVILSPFVAQHTVQVWVYTSAKDGCR